MRHDTSAEDERNLLHTIDHVADAERVWRPKHNMKDQMLDLTAEVARMIADLVSALRLTTSVAFDAVWSLTGIAICMAAVPRFVQPNLAPIGMAAMLIIDIPVSVLYWSRYRREEQVLDLLNELEDHILELEGALSERLDAIERNVI